MKAETLRTYYRGPHMEEGFIRSRSWPSLAIPEVRFTWTQKRHGYPRRVVRLHLNPESRRFRVSMQLKHSSRAPYDFSHVSDAELEATLRSLLTPEQAARCTALVIRAQARTADPQPAWATIQPVTFVGAADLRRAP